MPARAYNGVVILCRTTHVESSKYQIIKAYGLTYNMRRVLKSLGFSWDSNEHAWVKPAIKDITCGGGKCHIEYHSIEELRKELEDAGALVVVPPIIDQCPEFDALIPRAVYAVETPNGSLLVAGGSAEALVDLASGAIKNAPEPVGALAGGYGMYNVGGGEALVLGFGRTRFVYRNAFVYDNEVYFVLEELKEPIEGVINRLKTAYARHVCYRDCTADCERDCEDPTVDDYGKCLSECSEACWNACRNA
jgi:hypothetical protein